MGGICRWMSDKRDTAVSVPPLSKSYPDGRSYTRLDEVEAQLAELQLLPFDEIVRRGAITTKSHPEYMRPECLVHFLRSTRNDNGDARFNCLFGLLLQRFQFALPRSERSQGENMLVDGKLSDMNDHARSRFLALITIDRHGGDQLDFYEIHFDEAVAMLRLKARGQVGRRASRETPIDLDPETNELAAHVERAAGSLDPVDDTFLFDPHFRSRLLAAIDDLPTEQKEVVTMLMNDVQIEAKDPATRSISEILRCEVRTVQYRRTRAIAKLRRALGLGDGE
jgi:hypothetical protein